MIPMHQAKNRIIAAVVLIAASASGPAFAQQTGPIKPDTQGPTDTMTKQVPDMAPAAPQGKAEHPPTGRVGDAVPAMRPNDVKPAPGTDGSASKGIEKPVHKPKDAQ